MASGNANTRDIARQAIADQMLHLKSAWNELAPISQLPDELLLLIFKQVLSKKNPDYPWTILRLDADSHPWVSLLQENKWAELVTTSHVCRKWRATVMNCPSFWSRILFSNLCIMEEMLSRSSPVPVSVTIDAQTMVNHILSSPALSSLLTNSDRLKHLHLFLPNDSLHHVLATIPNAANFPHLRSLLIRDSATWQAQAPRDKCYIIPARLFSRPIHNLRHLYLALCAVPWDALQHCTFSLLSLRLEYVYPPSRTQFYGLLTANPNLESLYIESSLPKPSSDAVNPANLPKLSSCRIKNAAVRECVDFQKHVYYVPNKAKIHFRIKETADEVDIAFTGALLSACQEIFNHPDSSYLLVESRETYPKIIVSGNPCQADGRDMYWPSEDGEFYCTIDMQDYYDPSENQLPPRCLGLLSIPNAHTLIVNADPELANEDEWVNFFCRHPGITTLRICQYSTEIMLKALSKAYADDIQLGSPAQEPYQNASQNLRLFLPKLATLEFERFLPHDEPDSEECATMFDLLCGYLSTRRRHGLQIQRLNLLFCDNISWKMERILKKDVGQVMHKGADNFCEVHKDDSELEDSESEDSA